MAADATSAAQPPRGGPRPESLLDVLDRWDTLAFLTAFALLAFHPAPQVPTLILQVLLLAALVWPTARRHPATWIVVGGVVLLAAGLDWQWANNHDLLWGYWAVALGLSAAHRDRREVIARSARVLLGLVFGLAVLWKLLAPDFVSGDAIEWMLLTDARFAGVAETFAGLAPAEQAANASAMLEVTAWYASDTTASLATTSAVRPLAVAITWWALLAESAMAVSFLTPLRRHRIGEWLLVVFVVTTYTAVPVYRFGAVLALLGLAQTDRGSTVLRVAYAVAFLVMPIARAFPHVPFG